MAPAIVTICLVVILVLSVAVLAMPTEARIADETVLMASPEAAQRRLFGPLGSLRDSRLEVVSPGQWIIHTSYVPSGAVLVAVLFFPLGLVALLFARRKLVLHVRFLEEPGGATRLQVAGRARRRVAWDLGRAVDEARGATASAGAARTPR